MKATDRMIRESPIVQGADEEIVYTLPTTPWDEDNPPTNVSVVLKDSNGLDVSSTHLSGSATVSGKVITLPVLKKLTSGSKYRLEIKFTVGGNIEETFADVHGVT